MSGVPKGDTELAEIFDLSLYSERVEGFGQEKRYFSPFIARQREGDGWFPDNVIFGLQYTLEGSEKPIARVAVRGGFPAIQAGAAKG